MRTYLWQLKIVFIHPNHFFSVHMHLVFVQLSTVPFFSLVAGSRIYPYLVLYTFCWHVNPLTLNSQCFFFLLRLPTLESTTRILSRTFISLIFSRAGILPKVKTYGTRRLWILQINGVRESCIQNLVIFKTLLSKNTFRGIKFDYSTVSMMLQKKSFLKDSSVFFVDKLP